MSYAPIDPARAAYMRRQREGAARLDNSSRRSYEQFRSGIVSGGILDDRLAEAELIAAFGATRNSLRRSLQMLARDGLLVRRPRVGTAINGEILEFPTTTTPRASKASAAPAGDAEAAGEVAVVEVRDSWMHVVDTPAVIATRMALDAERILVHEQLGWYRDEPLFLRIGYLPMLADDAADGVVLDASHSSPIEETFEIVFGVPFGRASASIEAVPCDPEVAELMGLEPGWPMLVREMVLRDRDGQAREYSYTHFRGDRVALSARGDATARILD